MFPIQNQNKKSVLLDKKIYVHITATIVNISISQFDFMILEGNIMFIHSR